MARRFAGFSSVIVRREPNGTSDPVQHLLWGDWVDQKDERDGEWVKVDVRDSDDDGWVKEKQLQDNQLLEVNFVDIGQGDGCFVVTPDDKFLLIDAGQDDNMFRFLRWRFGLKHERNRDRVIPFDAAIMSHPDSDHYAGFEKLFDSKHFTFRNLYHNGILERTGEDLAGLGALSADEKYLLDLFPDRASLEAHVRNEAVVGRGTLARVMRKALDCAEDVRMLSVEDGWVPGYAENARVSLQVLAPIPEELDGDRVYRVFGDRYRKGPTKNGHSIVIKLRFGDVTMILGGDLNIPAEKYLLDHYAGRRDADGFLERARSVFRADIAKACHHGSADLSIDYLKAVDPIVTIVSSGDDEPHSHPRPDALGAFGRYGRGERPLIFSTELARSAPERIKNPNEIRQRVAELVALLNAAEDKEERERLALEIDKQVDLDRSVATYGMINVRTDGKRVVIAQRLEKAKNGQKWDIHELLPKGGELHYQSKH